MISHRRTQTHTDGSKKVGFLWEFLCNRVSQAFSIGRICENKVYEEKGMHHFFLDLVYRKYAERIQRICVTHCLEYHHCFVCVGLCESVAK